MLDSVCGTLRKSSAPLLRVGRGAAIIAGLIFAGAGDAAGVEIQLSASVVGKTPEQIGYNSGHFMPGSNTATWWKYSGVNAARVWATPATVEGNDDNAVWGDGVGSQQQFIERRTALRGDPLNTAFINWPYFENRYENSPTSGSNIVNLNYAFGALRDMGVDPVVVMHRTSERYPFDPAGTAAGWSDRWEQWHHFYAQAFYLAQNFDVHKFHMYNEPNHSSNGISQEEWLERLQLASDAVQSAVADVNTLYGKSLDPQMQAPVTAGGAPYFEARPGGDPRDDFVGWGELTMQNLHTNYLGQVDPNFKLIDTYAYQYYNQSGPTFGSELATIKNLVHGAAGGEPMRFSITEFNVHTAAVFDSLPETLDSPSKLSLFGSILANLAKNQPDELYVFKFSQTDDGDGVKKNGVHFVDNDSAPYDIGGITKGGEVVRLFTKGFAGAHDLLGGPTPRGGGSADLQMAAAFSPETNRYSLFSANTGLSQRDLEIDFSTWGISPGTIVTVEEVSADRHGEVRQLIEIPASGQIVLNQPAQSVFLVTASATLPTYRTTIGATDDAIVKAGRNSRFNFGNVVDLQAKNDPTLPEARNVSFIKFDLGDVDPAGIEQAVLRVFGENEDNASAPQVIAHVYGIASDDWTEATINWDIAPNLATTFGAVNDISHNFIEGIGATASIVGHFTGTQTGRELMLDVTAFVKDHPDSKITFLIAREVRFDGEDIDDSLTSLKIASKEHATDSGPQLLLSLSRFALPGDFDANGVVDVADYTLWRDTVGSTVDLRADGTGPSGDPDGLVDTLDYDLWKSRFGDTLPSSPADLSSASVPEPSAVILACIAIVGGSLRTSSRGALRPGP